MSAYISGLPAWQILCIAGVLLVILEMATPAMFFLNLAYFIKHDFSEKSLENIKIFWGDFLANPLILCETYYDYFVHLSFHLLMLFLCLVPCWS